MWRFDFQSLLGLTVALCACSTGADDLDVAGGSGGPNGHGVGATGGTGTSTGGGEVNLGETGGQGSGGTSAGAGGGSNSPDDCDDPSLTALVRDFLPCSGPQYEQGYIASCVSGHPDFETFGGDVQPPPCCGGMVESTLVDGKPEHVGTAPHVSSQWGQQTASAESFAQWYQDVDGVNIRVDKVLRLTRRSRGDGNGCTSADTCFVYDSRENASGGFFPIDGEGFGDEGLAEDDTLHNFGFTTEIHTEFPYEGGEVFTFSGDDDVWVFVNERLAIDLGGLHPRREGTVNLDAQAAQLGISVGSTYALDIFHAERHTGASNFRIETTIECIQDVPPPK